MGFADCTPRKDKEKHFAEMVDLRHLDFLFAAA
jgi:hypothetical protein